LPFARTLDEAGWTLISTGGTRRHLEEGGLEVTPVSEVTDFPEMFDGRVKTLHPLIHGGLLARRGHEGDRAEMDEHGVPDIRVVAVNLYPFEETVEGGAPLEEAAEMIDIGGPTLLRAAAKNHATQTVVCDPDDYERVGAAIASGDVDAEMRKSLAKKAFRHTGLYDAAIVDYLDGEIPDDDELPAEWPLGLRRQTQLRYGENPHQPGALYKEPLDETLGGFEQLHGKDLSYNNLVDLDAAVHIATEFDEPACAIIKHTNPAGCAVGDDLLEAYDDALKCDPMSAFGGIAAFTRPVDEAVAEEMHDRFWEVICAPAFSDAAMEYLTQRKNVRILRMPEELPEVDRALRATLLGVLVQGTDPRIDFDRGSMEVPTQREPTEDEWRALEFNWRVCKHVKSNAIVFGRETRTVGVGAGQMSRVDAVEFAIQKAREETDGCVVASDAFFPFRDGPDTAHEAGATAIIQPGGSRNDAEVIEACDEHDMAMVMTGNRHFRH
jgi:phosphoribosylaminoimidazolecarboxamide formyltransferase/IMP cyclohydrolase